MADERNLYRARRRAFIAACEAAKIDAIARVQPGKGADGKPLFTDTAAKGNRLAPRAMLMVSNDIKGSELQISMLKGSDPAPDLRIVQVHAIDPSNFGGPADLKWARAVLNAVATEDLSRVTALTLVDLTGQDLLPIVRNAMPRARIEQTGPE